MITLSDREQRRLGDRLNDPTTLPFDTVLPPAAPTEPFRGEVDDATADYVTRLREPFELLRQAEAQLAGLLVLAAASGAVIAGHPMLELAAEALRQASDEIRTAKAPPRARHHHRHVIQAVQALDASLGAARRAFRRCDEATIDAVLGPLRLAHQHLLWATTALPGFEIVALSQACCAQHATTQTP